MIVILEEFRTFKDKIRITKEFDGKADMEILDNKYVYIVIKEIGQ